MNYNFYGYSNCHNIKPIIDIKINNPVELYDILSNIWCKKTCAPRLQNEWSIDNKTLGQCSITAFLVQDIFGGEVYGIKIDDSNYHCYNLINGIKFDLTSEQFKEKLDYSNSCIQKREAHFSKQEKYERYLYLKSELYKYLNI